MSFLRHRAEPNASWMPTCWLCCILGALEELQAKQEASGLFVANTYVIALIVDFYQDSIHFENNQSLGTNLRQFF